MSQKTRVRRRKSGSCLQSLLLALIVVSATFFAASVLLERVETKLYPRLYSEYVERCCMLYDVPEDIVYAVIRTESGFDTTAVSSAGAVGLMQITPETYDWLLYLRKEEKLSPLTDPATCIDFGVYFLAYLYDRFGNWETVFAAYNAGMNRVTQWLEDENISRGGVLVNIPYTETSDYVKKVDAARIRYRQLYYDKTISQE